jgi:hypothetical protein
MADGFDAFREALSAFLEANQFLGLALYVGIEEVGVPFPIKKKRKEKTDV